MREANKELLNGLGREWTELPPDAPAERKALLAEEIFVMVYRLFPQFTEAIGAFFEKDWSRFDAKAGTLYGFCSSRLNWRMKKLRMSDDGVIKKHSKGGSEDQEDPADEDYTKDPEEEKKRRDQYVRPLRLDDPSAPGSKTTLRDQLADLSPNAGDPEETALYDDAVLRFVSLALQFPSRLTGRAANSERLNYFRMFFTDSVVDILQRGNDSRPFADRELDLFQAMQLGFLDYFMAKLCRSVRDLCRCDLKLYGQLVPGRPMRKPRQPLANDIYITYLNTAEGYHIRSKGTISNQRKEFKRFLRERL